MSSRKRIAIVSLGAVLAAAGVGAGLAVADPGSGGATAPTAASSAADEGTGQVAPTWMTSYSGYAAMMGRYGGAYGMMGGAGASGGMMGGSGAYGTHGPNGMMYGGTDMGRIMGGVLAGEPGPRVSAAQAGAAANAVPTGARADASTDTVTFTSLDVALSVVAGPNDRAMYRFEIAGLIDPTLVVPSGAHVTLRFINTDTDMAHGIVITAADRAAATSWMPMMTAVPAFTGAGIWALGEQTSSGAPIGSADFTATTPGSYTYLCPIPGHTQQGMYGVLTVR